MRTRFINTDYFTTKPLGTFLHLPVPHQLPSSSFSDYEQDLITCFNAALDVTSIDLGIEVLPVDGALDRFLSSVIPQKIEFNIEEFDEDAVGKDLHETRLFQKENETTVHENGRHELEAVQFEEPHMDLFLMDGSFSEQEDMNFLPEVPDAKINLDTLLSELQMQYPRELLESVYTLENVTSGHIMDQEASTLEDAGFVQDQNPISNCTFPILEVSEMSLLGASLDLPLVDEFHLLLENIEPQSCTQNDLMVYGKELVDTFDIKLLENIPDSSLKQCLESEKACLDEFLEKDYICTAVSSSGQGNSASHEGTSAGECFVSISPILFQEIQILDVDSSQSFEIFSDDPSGGKIDASTLMEDMDLKTFNELVVIHELALTDDTFKSFPVPILSDHEIMKSLYDIVEEILEDMKPQPLPATDGIYLDWHLLEEDKCNYQYMLNDMSNYNIDFDLKSTDWKMVVLDFVFKEETLSKPYMEESKQSMSVLSGDLSVHDAQFVGVNSTKKLENSCQNPGKGEVSVESNAEGVSQLFESMSQFNDLDFFLNPRKVAHGGNRESMANTLNTNATFPMVPSCGLPSERVEWENCSGSDAIYEGANVPRDPRSARKVQSHILDKRMKDQKLKELPNSIPIGQKINLGSSQAEDSLEGSHKPFPASFVPFDTFNMDSKKIRSNVLPYPDKVIVVNTQNFEKEMIISRRSTYQKILAMEKEGAQVVERDSDMPVDVIINAAVCLAWYDSRNIGNKSTPRDDGSSCLPLCVENIATNILTTLSFAFSSCILVFEGDMNFNAEIMDSSDELYAAAACLGMDLQLFYSYSSELTDEIILNSIKFATKSTRGLYPAMPESETLAESFLTHFPSINSLSAHAVLSSGGTLFEFLEWSHEGRIQSIRKYQVPEESVSLLSALCRYGEREESKSGTTDCSSSVSSAPDTENLYRTISERKKQKTTSCPQKFESPVNTFLQFERPHSSRIPKYHESGISSGGDISNEINEADLTWNELFFSERQGTDRALTDNLNWQGTSKSGSLHGDFVGEVIDCNGDSFLDAEFSSILNSGMYSTSVNAEKKDQAPRNVKTAGKLSFGHNVATTFPVAAEMDNDLDLWDSLKHHQKQNPNQDAAGFFDTDFNVDGMPLMQSRDVAGEGSKQFPSSNFNELLFHYRSDTWTSMKDCKHNLTQVDADKDFNVDHMPLKQRRELPREDPKVKSANNCHEFSFHEKDVSHFGQTPLRNAIFSSQLQQGSPLTMEFLNRIREKSRLRQQSLPCDMSSPDFGLAGNISKSNKRKSPTILDFYQYKGGGAPRKGPKRQKQSMPPSTQQKKKSMPPSSSSKGKRTSIWTPLDKRARHALSFAPSGSGSQSKLVWSDIKEQNQNRRF